MTESEKFYQWLLNMGNRYIDNNERMQRAFEIVNENT